MPQVTQEKRTVMYSVEPNGHVARHVFPFNADEPIGMSKLQKFVKRGFTFDDPRLIERTGVPEVIVTRQVEIVRVEEEPALRESEEEKEKGTIEVMEIPENIVTKTKGEATPGLVIKCLECGKGPFVSFLGLQLHRDRYCGKPPERHHRKKGKR